MNADTAAITIAESKDLIALEAIIEKNKEGFVKCGEALAQIRDRKLYRIEHATFEDYLQMKWGFSRRYANRLVAAAETTKLLDDSRNTLAINKNLGPIGPEKKSVDLQHVAKGSSRKTLEINENSVLTGDENSTLPTTESQTRPLSGLAPDQQKEAWAAAVNKADGKQPTAKTVSQAAAEMRAKAAAKKPDAEVVRDSTGYAIPENLLELWGRRSEVKAMLDAISAARSVLRKVMEATKDGSDCDLLYAPANVSGAYGHLNNAWTMASMAMPYAVCPVCNGPRPKECKLCRGRGLIPKHTFENAIPPEIIAIRAKSCVVKEK